MADRRISTDTLTDIADAIRAKTGNSALITPQDMASEIESIETGGGTKILTKLAEYTVDSPVATLGLNATEQMQNCDILYIVADLVLSASDWIYPYINGVAGAGGTAMGYFTTKTDHMQQSFGLAHLSTVKGAASRFVYIGDITSANRRQDSSLSSINFRNYTSGVTFNSGTVEVWGYV